LILENNQLIFMTFGTHSSLKTLYITFHFSKYRLSINLLYTTPKGTLGVKLALCKSWKKMEEWR